jgi:hypothetical protein
MRREMILRHFFAAAVLLVSTSYGWSGCLTPPISPDTIAAFKANPLSLLSDPRLDMRALERETRNLAAANAGLANDLIQLAASTGKVQQSAIAAGLAQAALACLANDVLAAQEIQLAVAKYENGAFQATFAAIAGDLDTAAISTATSAAASGNGSIIIVNPNPSTGNNLFGAGGAGAGPGPSTVISLFTVSGLRLSTTGSASAASVSPTH